MGRFVKNATIPTGSYAIRLPVGTGLLGPITPVDGQIRFNESNSKVEMYFSGNWNQIAKIGRVPLTVDDLGAGDDSTTSFTMSLAAVDASDIMVTIGGIYQTPGNNYVVSGDQIVFTSPPPSATVVSPNKIIVVHGINSTNAA